MIDDKERQLEELAEEIDIVYSVKEEISSEEIQNFLSKFTALSELEVRTKIEEVTGETGYVQEFLQQVAQEPIYASEDAPVDLEENTSVAKLDDFHLQPVAEEEEKPISSQVQGEKPFSAELREEKELSPEEIFEMQIEKMTTQKEKAAQGLEKSFEEPLPLQQGVDKKDTSVPVKEDTKQKEERDSISSSGRERDRISKGSKRGKEKEEEKKISPWEEENIPEVSYVKVDIKYGQLSLEWGWPEEAEEILLCYSMDHYPVGPKDPNASQCNLRRKGIEEKGTYTFPKIEVGNYYFCIYVVAHYVDKTLYSQGVKRLETNAAPTTIYYEIQVKKSLFGKIKSASLVLSTEEAQIDLPQLVLVGKVGNMPYQKAQGKTLCTTEYQTITKNQPLTIALPMEQMERNMYVKLFFFEDSNSKVCRIISPAKEKLYFK